MNKSLGVSFKNIKLHYALKNGSTKCIFNNLNLSVEPGEFCGLIGPSGSGKTTILRIAAGLIKPDIGEVTIGGKPPDYSRSNGKISFVFQNPVLLDWRNIFENINLPKELLDQKLEAKTVLGLLAEVGLKEHAYAYPDMLSGGMQSRVALARALTTKPDLLLMDEPFSDVDEIRKDSLFNLLLKLWQENSFSVIYVTHNLVEAVLLSDRILAIGTNGHDIIAEIKIDLQRPRTEEMTYTKKFQEYVGHLRKVLTTEYQE